MKTKQILDGDQIIITIIDSLFIFLFAIFCIQGHANAQKLQRMKKWMHWIYQSNIWKRFCSKIIISLNLALTILIP